MYMHLLKIVSPEEKENFYDTLGDVFDKCPKPDLKIIIRDMNTKIGKEAVYRKQEGKRSLHDIQMTMVRS